MFIRNLHKARIGRKKIFPKKIEQIIEMQWRRFENTKPAAYIAMNITAIFKKV
jgi:hypothetical protein